MLVLGSGHLMREWKFLSFGIKKPSFLALDSTLVILGNHMVFLRSSTVKTAFGSVMGLT